MNITFQDRSPQVATEVDKSDLANVSRLQDPVRTQWEVCG